MLVPFTGPRAPHKHSPAEDLRSGRETGAAESDLADRFGEAVEFYEKHFHRAGIDNPGSWALRTALCRTRDELLAGGEYGVDWVNEMIYGIVLRLSRAAKTPEAMDRDPVRRREVITAKRDLYLESGRRAWIMLTSWVFASHLGGSEDERASRQVFLVRTARFMERALAEIESLNESWNLGMAEHEAGALALVLTRDHLLDEGVDEELAGQAAAGLVVCFSRLPQADDWLERGEADYIHDYADELTELGERMLDRYMDRLGALVSWQDDAPLQ